jgi:hypothetical protein
MGAVISALEKETSISCFDTFRRCLDRERASVVEYDDIARDWQSRAPAFRLFLDGSRRTYKIADIPIGTQVFPIIAGQVGVGVCKRENRRLSKCALSLHTVLAFPDKLDTEGKNEKQHRAFPRQAKHFAHSQNYPDQKQFFVRLCNCSQRAKATHSFASRQNHFSKYTNLFLLKQPQPPLSL